jgi:DNA-directed RNA polymerase subunit N (RpoN/RPB10)
MEPMMCYECGLPLSSIKEAFDMMRQIKTIEADQKNPTHISKRAVNTDLTVVLVDAFEALGVRRYCCKNHLTTIVNFHDLECE